uniref:angiopoietin-4 isoform X1 n=1 Tax=Ictidomys tridecemlineatus TaxID=43179 RepID=UPI001A9EF8F0|nr:angiopoietin-4 isoform X1 [Ictidomys tridecemlineatus]
MLSRAAMLLGGLLLAVATMIAAQRSGPEAAAQCQVHLVQSGPCSYTFVLPDPQLCPLGDPGSPDSLQRDVSPTAPSASLGAWRAQRMRQLEKALENSTLRLQKLERYIQMNLRSKLARAQQHMVQNQTAAMLELGSDILNETAARTSDVEAKVLNETSRLEVQMMETSLSTEELEKQLLQHSNELHRLQGRSSALETRLQALETQQQEDLASLREEKEQLRRLLGNHSGALAVLERSLRLASSNSSLLQMQQRQLLESVQRLVHVMAQGPGGSAAAPMRAPEQMFQDCAEIRRSGATADGVYTIRVANDSEPKKVGASRGWEQRAPRGAPQAGPSSFGLFSHPRCQRRWGCPTCGGPQSGVHREVKGKLPEHLRQEVVVLGREAPPVGPETPGEGLSTCRSQGPTGGGSWAPPPGKWAPGARFDEGLPRCPELSAQSPGGKGWEENSGSGGRAGAAQKEEGMGAGGHVLLRDPLSPQSVRGTVAQIVCKPSSAPSHTPAHQRDQAQGPVWADSS